MDLWGNQPTGTAQRYNSLTSIREPYLRAAERSASLTLPYLLPRDKNGNYRKVLPEPFNSVGANGVVGLAGTLTTALYPITQSFRLIVPNDILATLNQIEGGEEIKEQLSIDVVEDEILIQKEIETNHWRATTNEVITHLLITGNVCEQILPDNSIRTFALDEYVVIRDMVGEVLELITCESYTVDTLPDDLRELANVGERGQPSTGANVNNEDYKLYTHIILNTERGMYEATQSLGHKKIPNSEQEFDLGYLPYNILFYDIVSGESYGRGLAERVISDLQAVDLLQQAVLEGAGLASRLVYLVSPSASADTRKKLSSAKNGDVITGTEDDIHILQAENRQNLEVLVTEIQRKEQSIGKVFLNSADSVRRSERTTAEEVRLLRSELENGLGGFFTRLSDEMLLPRVRWLIRRMRIQGQISQSPFEPEILTGVEALSREQDLQSAQLAIQSLQSLPPEMLEYINPVVLLGEVFRGLNLPNALRTQDEVNEMRQQAMLQQGASQLIDSAATTAGQTIGQPANQDR